MSSIKGPLACLNFQRELDLNRLSRTAEFLRNYIVTSLNLLKLLEVWNTLLFVWRCFK